MFFTASLYVSLAVFALGLIFKISTWFRYRLGDAAQNISTTARINAAIKGILTTLLSAKVLVLLRVLVLDVFLQARTLRQDFLRWLMHICLYGGFMLLLLMHALDRFITAPLFPAYQSTLNPFMFLRDLFGALVLVGVILALYRRFVLKIPRLRTSGQDYYALAIVAVIIVSGVLLEAVKIPSQNSFQEMVAAYVMAPDEEEIQALEAYWVANYGLASARLAPPFEADLLELGQEIHENSCLECHSRPQAAFLGYVTSRIIKPAALALDRAQVPTILWYLHFLACWLGLAYLPFSKMFHLISSPISLLANSVMDDTTSAPANIATRQVMELDACTHCGTCSVNCSVGVVAELVPNPNILPSEKLGAIKALAAGKPLSAAQLRLLGEGVYLCTNCRRCTVVCPVGINLQELWFRVREALLRRDLPQLLALSPLSFFRGLRRAQLEDPLYPRPLERALKAVTPPLPPPEAILTLPPPAPPFKEDLQLSVQAATFAACFACETCTTLCPVVAEYENPQETLGLLPHQIMHACGLGVRELALGSTMLWSCVTCYQCQEGCPQGVQITDIFYELKNMAIKEARSNGHRGETRQA